MIWLKLDRYDLNNLQKNSDKILLSNQFILFDSSRFGHSDGDFSAVNICHQANILGRRKWRIVGLNQQPMAQSLDALMRCLYIAQQVVASYLYIIFTKTEKSQHWRNRGNYMRTFPTTCTCQYLFFIIYNECTMQ